MARPERNNVDYFPFLCKEGKAMFYIEQKYGNDGYATWVKLLRQLAVNNYHYINLNDKVELMFLASKCKVSEETLKSIILDLCDLGEFNLQLWTENMIVWSDKFVEHIKDAYEKRRNKCIDFDGLLEHLSGLGVRKPSKLPLKGVINPQSKEEYTKEEESSVHTHTGILGIDYILSYQDTSEEFKSMYKEEFYKSWLTINRYLNEECKYLRTWNDQITIAQYKMIYDKISKGEYSIQQAKQALSDLDGSKQAKEKYNSVYHGFNTYIKFILKNV